MLTTKQYQKQYQKQWWIDNKNNEHHRALRKKWMEDNKEEFAIYSAKNYRERKDADPIKFLLRGAHSRCKKNGMEFCITKDDLLLPTHCPVLGMELVYGAIVGKGMVAPYNTASLDRIDNNKGYIKGNVIIVSKRANVLKRDATIQEMEALYTFYKNIKTVTEEIYGD
jgi:hypothetical protein